MIVQIDRMPLREFRRFIKFLILEKDKRFKDGQIYDGDDKIAFVYSVKAGKEDNIMMEINTGFGSSRRLSKFEKREKAENIYRELYTKFKHGEIA